jgi:hypothetical protein
MSKKPKSRVDTAYIQTTWCEVDPPRAQIDVDADAVHAATGRTVELPGELRQAIRDTASNVFGSDCGLTAWDIFSGRTDAKAAFRDVAARAENDFLEDLVRDAVDAGFRLAIQRYATQLQGIPELAHLKAKRLEGGDIGRARLTDNKETRFATIRETWAAMEAAGKKVTNKAVAAAVGCSESTVIRAFKSKPATRRKR